MEGKDVLYVTERAVFKLGHSGLELVGVAPGVDVEIGILAKMEFAPGAAAVAKMEKRMFCEGRLGLREEVLREMRR